MKTTLSKTLIFLFLLLSNLGNAQKIKNATITFVVPKSTDEKDWNTQVDVRLNLSDGTNIGNANYNSCNSNTPSNDVKNCFCCVKPERNSQGSITNQHTEFTDNGNSYGPFQIVISNPVEKNLIQNGYILVKITPKGNDRWVFKPILELTFDDNSKIKYSNIGNNIVSQEATETTIVFHKGR